MTKGDYEWIETSWISEAGCVTVVPSADERAVLAAYGAVEASGRPVDSFEALEWDDGSSAPICVVKLDEAIVVFEENGFQGSRVEVLEPASKASRAYIASSFFWNVNAVTAFSAARRGKTVFSVELIGDEDDDLTGVPKPLRRHVVAAGQDGSPDESGQGGMLAAGLDLVARWTRVNFTRAATTGGIVYDTEPPPSELPTHVPERCTVYGIAKAPQALAELAPEQQRQVAQWAATAAAQEGDIAGEPAVERLLGQLGNHARPDVSPVVDALARATAKLSDRFRTLEEMAEVHDDLPPHPFYELTINGPWGETKVLSHLEALYLAQRSWALQSLRYLLHDDDYSAALGCLNAASFAFHCGRTERDWTFTENASGRFHTGEETNARHTAFVEAANTLITHLHDAPDVAIASATEALPVPLTADNRSAAIRADAQAAADGAFRTYQTGRAQDESSSGVGK